MFDSHSVSRYLMEDVIWQGRLVITSQRGVQNAEEDQIGGIDVSTYCVNFFSAFSQVLSWSSPFVVSVDMADYSRMYESVV